MLVYAYYIMKCVTSVSKETFLLCFDVHRSKIYVTPQRCLLAHFETIFDFSRNEFTCPQ